jgi:hypothetical protein
MCARFQVRTAFKDKKFLPLDIRTKKTRALRRKLTTAQVQFFARHGALVVFLF